MSVCVAGVPIRSRSEVWQLLVFHHRLHHAAPAVSHVDNYDTSYLQLIKQLTSFQREILTDLGTARLGEGARGVRG